MRTDSVGLVLDPAANRSIRFAVVGDLVQDIVVILSQPLHLGGQAEAEITHHRGGSAANIASHLAHLGAKARFIGRVGSDRTGDWLIQELQNSQVDVCVTRSGKSSTVVCVVGEGGQRSFIADTAASGRTDDGKDALESEYVEDAHVLHLSGYWLCGAADPKRLVPMVRNAKAAGVLVTVDAGNFDRLRSFGRGIFLDLLDALSPDILFLNQDEWEELALESEAPPAPVVLCTRGKQSTIVYQDGKIFLEQAVAPVTDVIDTTGAGDAFVAGFLYKLCSGDSLTEAIVHGHTIAGKVISSAGATPRT